MLCKKLSTRKRCHFVGGDLVELVTGDISCSIVNNVHECSSGNRIPVKLEVKTDGPVLVTNVTTAGNIYLLFIPIELKNKCHLAVNFFSLIQHCNVEGLNLLQFNYALS